MRHHALLSTSTGDHATITAPAADLRWRGRGAGAHGGMAARDIVPQTPRTISTARARACAGTATAPHLHDQLGQAEIAIDAWAALRTPLGALMATAPSILLGWTRCAAQQCRPLCARGAAPCACGCLGVCMRDAFRIGVPGVQCAEFPGMRPRQSNQSSSQMNQNWYAYQKSGIWEDGTQRGTVNGNTNQCRTPKDTVTDDIISNARESAHSPPAVD